MLESFALRREALRFAIAGVLVTGLHVIVAVGFIRLVLPAPPLANGVAFVVATAFSYLINTLWSFSSPLYGRNLFRFVVVSMVGCLLAVTVSGIAEYYGLHYWIGIAGVACIVPPMTFLLHSFWTYR